MSRKSHGNKPSRPSSATSNATSDVTSNATSDVTSNATSDVTSGATPDTVSDAGGGQARQPGAGELAVGQWHERARPVRRTFPGPRVADVPLRVALEAPAYSEIIVHAKQSLDAEICGVLAGRVCEDDDGLFVHVEAAVRGERAKEGSAHVTYTHETWNAVHATIERDYPRLSIVGWYHSHPGFGVEFSDMDRFIQQNFFSGPCQVGLVTDPLSGDLALCYSAADGIQYLDRCWIAGREQRCRAPSTARDSSRAASPAGADALEIRLTQLVQAVDELRTSLYRWLTVLGMAAALLVALVMARQAYLIAFGDIPDVPRNIAFAGVPVNVDGKSCLLGVQVVKWQIPPELLAIPPQSPDDEEAESEKDGQSKKGDRAEQGDQSEKSDRAAKKVKRKPASHDGNSGP